jgi:hypothetical protein
MEDVQPPRWPPWPRSPLLSGSAWASALTRRSNLGVLLDPASGRPRVTGRAIELIFSTIATTSVDDDTDLRYDE